MMTMQCRGRSHELALAEVFFKEFLVMHAHYHSCIVITPKQFLSCLVQFFKWLLMLIFFLPSLLYNLPLAWRDYRCASHYFLPSVIGYGGIWACNYVSHCYRFWAPDVRTQKTDCTWRYFGSSTDFGNLEIFSRPTMEEIDRRNMLRAVQGWKLRLYFRDSLCKGIKHALEEALLATCPVACR